MAHEPLAAAHQQTIAERFGLAIAEAEGAAASAERQHPGHRLGLVVGVVELLAQQQQAAALGQQRQTRRRRRRQIPQAAAARRQLGGMQFRIAPRQDHRPAAGR